MGRRKGAGSTEAASASAGPSNQPSTNEETKGAAPSQSGRPKWVLPLIALTVIVIAMGGAHKWQSTQQKQARFNNARSDFVELTPTLRASDLATLAEPSIFLMWTTVASTFRGRNAAVLDTYLFHHPRAHVTVYASHLPLDYFSHYVAAGYDVKVERLDDDFILGLGNVCPGGRWLSELSRWQTGPYYYSHLTDFLRFCLLYRNGGVYSDFDALLLQPLDIAAWGPSFIGKDRVRAYGTPADCGWCLPGGTLYLAPGVMGSSAGGSLPRGALVEGFETEYNPNIFNAVGPRAVTVAFRNLAPTSAMPTLLESHVLYPFSYWEVNPLFNASYAATGDPELDARRASVRAKRIAASSHSLHLYGHMSRFLEVEPGSLVDNVIQSNRVLSAGKTAASLVAPEYDEISKPEQRVTGIRLIVGRDDASATGSVFSLNVKVTGAAKIAVAGKSSQWTSAVSFDRMTAAQVNDALAELHVQRSSDDEFDLVVTVSSSSLPSPLRSSTRFMNVRNLLTIMIKTFDRMHKAFSLVESIRLHYPDVRIIVADDGEGAQSYVTSRTSTHGVHRREFLFLPLPFDVGLSAGRNRMLALVQTRFFLTLDDDFLFDANSNLAHLLWPVLRGHLDIAAGKNPRDEAAYGFDFCGLLRVTNDTLDLVAGKHGHVTNCDVVDIVPNLFVGVTESVRNVRWDDELKLGEHEDFFLRVKRAGLRVGSCPLTSFVHGQEASWQGGVENKYNNMRRRIYDFWKLSLEKHGLNRLRSFGTVMMILQPPGAPQGVVATEVLSRSARVSWRGVDDANRFNVTYAEKGGRVVRHVDLKRGVVGETVLLKELEPSTTYVVHVRAGHFLFEEKGATITFTTKPDSFVGALQNFGFERGMLPWVGTFGTTFHTVASSALSGVLSGRLQIHAAAQLSKTPAVMQIDQSVYVGRPLGGVLLGVHSRLEQIFGEFQDITYEARVVVHFEEDDHVSGGHVEDGHVRLMPVRAVETFSPYTNDWQAVSIHVGLMKDKAYPVHHVDVSLLLGGYRGSAVFDHVILALLDEEGPALPALK